MGYGGLHGFVKDEPASAIQLLSIYPYPFCIFLLFRKSCRSFNVQIINIMFNSSVVDKLAIEMRPCIPVRYEVAAIGHGIKVSVAQINVLGKNQIEIRGRGISLA
ncbi:hypothetical protein ACJJIK_06425 [Microbulbifer sp. ZKSA006]|uniref:hypothetical protein n=1 Tax=Microbulbifer sp. ZKSA006 TaxID=3243390 RepID=UPI00403A4B7D